MVDYVVTDQRGTTTPSTPAFTLADSDTLYVAPAGLLYALGSGSNVVNASSNNVITLDGDLISHSGLAISASGGGHNIRVNTGSTLRGGIDLTGGFNVIVNAGTIDQALSPPVTVTPASINITSPFGNNHIINTGTLADSVFLNGFDNRVENSGSIGGAVGDITHLINMGDIGGVVVGGHSSSDHIVVQNSGTIGRSVDVSNERSTVENSGSILGLLQIGGGAGLVNQVTNRGLLNAGIVSVFNANDVILNVGTIHGNPDGAGVAINLSGGNDVLDNGGGTITGEIRMGGGNDLVVSGLGAETINGGAEIDTISYAAHSAAMSINLAAATASDGSVADSILNFENAIGSRFGDQVIGSFENNVIDGVSGTDQVVFSNPRGIYTITPTSTGLVVSGIDGVDTLINVERLVFMGEVVTWSSARSDFAADGNSDLLWRHSSGALSTWHMNGSTAVPNAFQANVATDWLIAGVGDFGGDGRADLLWRHASGAVRTWEMNGTQATPNVFAADVSPEWHFRGVGDFNGDGRDDLLWRNINTGTLTTWQMNGATSTPNVFQANVTTDWHVAGLGDFNGDGRDDLLWRHVSGALSTWEMNGNSATANAFTAQVGTDWNIAGTGDFNGDGIDDLLFRHDGGTITTWQMNGSTATPNVLQAIVSNDFTVAQVGDFNGDGRDDLMWRHTNGSIATWEMNGATAAANVFQANVGTDWTLFKQQFDLV